MTYKELIIDCTTITEQDPYNYGRGSNFTVNCNENIGYKSSDETANCVEE